jgi:flagellar biosynthesis/type III secretory pathway chaperone
LLARLRECAASAVRCRDLNDRNAIVVAARLKRVEGMLDALTGRPTRADTYGPRGYANSNGRPGRVLGAA